MLIHKKICTLIAPLIRCSSRLLHSSAVDPNCSKLQRRLPASLLTAKLRRYLSTSTLCPAMSSNKKLGPAQRIAGMEESVWIEFGQLALEHKPLNLGQGFPDFAAPDHVTKGLADATTSKNVLLNQYTRGFGHPRLVNALSKLYSKLINRPLDPLKELLVTIGAYEALFCAIQGHVNPGDEVIVIEPFYDCYGPMIEMCGGVPVYIPLKPKRTGKSTSSGDWALDPDELAGKFSSKTKAIIVNNPNNPLGKVYTRSELEMIAELSKKHNVLVIMDEVYEWLIYRGNKHVRMATLPDMWDRTVTIGSAGKTFSVTGWKLGWAYGPEPLIRNMQILHQNCVYTCPTPIQEAVATSFELELQRLDKPECYFNELPAQLEAKRNLIVKYLEDVDMDPVVPEGGYFIIADFSKLGGKINFDSGTKETKDYKFAKWLLKEKKLSGIPPAAFYSSQHKQLASNYIRFCFIKEDENLMKAGDILKNLKKSLL